MTHAYDGIKASYAPEYWYDVCGRYHVRTLAEAIKLVSEIGASLLEIEYVAR